MPSSGSGRDPQITGNAVVPTHRSIIAARSRTPRPCSRRQQQLARWPSNISMIRVGNWESWTVAQLLELIRMCSGFLVLEITDLMGVGGRRFRRNHCPTRTCIDHGVVGEQRCQLRKLGTASGARQFQTGAYYFENELSYQCITGYTVWFQNVIIFSAVR